MIQFPSKQYSQKDLDDNFIENYDFSEASSDSEHRPNDYSSKPKFANRDKILQSSEASKNSELFSEISSIREATFIPAKNAISSGTMGFKTGKSGLMSKANVESKKIMNSVKKKKESQQDTDT